jgi:hypothetical protein
MWTLNLAVSGGKGWWIHALLISRKLSCSRKADMLKQLKYCSRLNYGRATARPGQPPNRPLLYHLAPKQRVGQRMAGLPSLLRSRRRCSHGDRVPSTPTVHDPELRVAELARVVGRDPGFGLLTSENRTDSHRKLSLNKNGMCPHGGARDGPGTRLGDSCPKSRRSVRSIFPL